MTINNLDSRFVFACALLYNLLILAGTTFLVVEYNWSIFTYIFALCLIIDVEYAEQD